MKSIKVLGFIIAPFVSAPTYSQNEYVQVKMSEIRKGINPTFQGATNGNAYFSYIESMKEAKSMKIVGIDKDLKPGKVQDYRGVYFGKAGAFAMEVVNDKLYGFYGHTKYPKYCLTDLGMEVFDLKTGALAKPVTDNFKQSEEYKCDLWSITSVSSRNKKHTALVQYGLKPKALIWMYDESMKEQFQKVIELKTPNPKLEPDYEGWEISDNGDLYFCYYVNNKIGTDCFIAKVTSSGSTVFTKVPLSNENRYAILMELDQQGNPVISFTKAVKNTTEIKGVIHNGYGVIKFDKNLQVLSQINLNISSDILNATKRKGEFIEGCHYLFPKQFFTRSDGSMVLIAEQDADMGTAGFTDEARRTGTLSIVVFIIGKNNEELRSFIIPKSQSPGGDFSSFSSFHKGENIYLFYNEDFINENLPRVSFLMRVIPSDNNLTSASVIKEKGKEEKGNLNVKTDLYEISEDEALFIVSGANGWGSGNSDNYQLMSVKFLK